MTLGAVLAEMSTSAAGRLLTRCIGTADFHTHRRLAWLRRYPIEEPAHVCELGCGQGIALFEIVRRHSRACATGFEASAELTAQAQRAASLLGVQDRLTFRRLDLQQGLPLEVRAADYVLLLDVVEHMPRATALAAALVEHAKVGARVLVSVPTPLYPAIFGRRYHEQIGHVRDGYTLQQLDELFGGLRRLRVRYSTGPLSWPGVVLCYRGPWARSQRRGPLARAAGALATIAALPFRWLDFVNGPRVSCSLFVEYRKEAPSVREAH